MAAYALLLSLAVLGHGPRAHVTVDCSRAPDTQAWADQAKKLVEQWYPKIVSILDAPRKDCDVELVFDPDNTGVAATSGHRIDINPDWIRKHPEDKGMVVHELTHVVQAYPQYDPSWLVEGIADWVRFFHYEPKTKIAPPTARQSYKNAYRVTARFLDWACKKYDKKLVVKFDHAMRAGTYTNALWATYCGGVDLDGVWAEYEKEEGR